MTGPIPLPHFNIRITQGLTFSVSDISDIAFFGCSEILLLTRNFAIFTVYASISGQFTATFYFF